MFQSKRPNIPAYSSDNSFRNAHAHTKTSSRLLSMLRGALSVVWPDNCPLCGRRLTGDETVMCLHCLAQMPRTDNHLTDNNRVTQLILPLTHDVRAANWFYYDTDSPYHTLIHDIKYHDARRRARLLGREFAAMLSSDGFFDNHPVDVILPIPLHWTRHLRRNYNQAELVAKGMADITGITIGDNLYTTRRHDSQTRQQRSERALNVKDIFGVRDADLLDRLHIAILDDVITTGSTITAAANALINAGVRPASLTLMSLGLTKLR